MLLKTAVMCIHQIHPPQLQEISFQVKVQLSDFSLEMQHTNTAQNLITFLDMQMQPLELNTAALRCFPRDWEQVLKCP